MGQTCTDFTWIVLFDSQTPDEYKARVADYQRLCSQFVPVFVAQQDSRHFARFFGDEMRKRIDPSARVLSTYLGNDNGGRVWSYNAKAQDCLDILRLEMLGHQLRNPCSLIWIIHSSKDSCKSAPYFIML